MNHGGGPPARENSPQRIGHLKTSPVTVTVTYVAYYNTQRVHTGLGDSPDGRPIEARPSPTGRVVALPRVGGLHYRHVWAEAA